MTDPLTNYAGGPRHAPQAQISSMGQDQVGGTSGILNAAGRSRPRRGTIGAVGAMSSLTGPLRREQQAEILGSAKLGRRPPGDNSTAEQMSDADGPNQAVEVGNNGPVHHRWNPDGSVSSTPVGSPSDSMPANPGELQQRMPVPNFFGNGA